MLRAPLSLLLALALVGCVAGQYLENQEYDVDENGLPMDSGNTELDEEDPTLVDKREDEDKLEEAFIMSTSKPLGEISGIAIDKKGRLVVFHRADRVWDENTFDESDRLAAGLAPIANSTIAIVNATTGQVLEEHGEGLFYLPHGLSIDSEGNIWVTDVGSHQVHKLGADYKPVLTLGEKMVPGTDGAHFCKPTDVAVAKNGIFFVADGYCNSRVIKYDRNGNVLAVFEAPDDNLGSSPFLIPHSLALIADLNLLCVADRENERVQCYSSGLAEGHRSIPAGIPITSAENIGRVYAIREKNHYLVGVTGADGDGTLEPQLFTMDMETGKANTFLKGIENAHALAISDEGKVYVGQMQPNQIVVVDLA
ncbi:hypothetical protein PMAYCL1PPCAC_26404 [Pristionchus mayeri]|uniref:peptidylamidoglycolate lyase n=1 Tax=Pristionchus mayeri TaxID=1317129 RepID=A0AAN5D4E5_9BILA|nr:hypothetical protein PMAYCL1PPCAC_26404 [Pristionchus mayeri]